MDKLYTEIEKRLKIKIVTKTIPPQGMASSVVFITDTSNLEYAIKLSTEENNDANVLQILQKANCNISVPKLIDSFKFENTSVVIMEKINHTLLEEIEPSQMHLYIPSMIKNLRNLHKIKSEFAGYLNSPKKYVSWQDFLLSFFDGRNPNLDWSEIANRPGVDRQIISMSVAKIIQAIQNTKLLNSDYCLIHTDFNQRNLFVDTKTTQIGAIIDWGEAMYGDPIFDFSRIRMLIWHFDLGENVAQNYYKELKYSTEQKNLDTLYWVFRAIEYIAYYSEELNSFNVGRIDLHQTFLKNCDWSMFGVE